jgi:LysR family transcriptional regulator, glycine cleavage system transcriptional activator
MMARRRVRENASATAFDRLPLNALRVFEAVATQMSFADAAEALHVTPAAVSMQVRTLEDYLQVPLFRRAGRSIELTPEGALLLPGVRRGLGDLQTALHQLRQSRSAGTLNISTLASFLQKWLLPRLPQLHDQHGDLQLRIHTSRAAVDFSQSDFHGALRMTTGPEAGLHCEKLLDEWFVLVCSPELYQRFGPVREAADLKRYPLLRSSDEPWQLWNRPTADRDWKEHGTAFDDSVTVLTAAEQGQGLGLTRWCLAAGDISLGRLVLASTTVLPCPRAYYFVCPEAYLAMPKLQVLLKWLRAKAREFASPPGAPAAPAAPATPATPARAATAARRPAGGTARRKA